MPRIFRIEKSHAGWISKGTIFKILKYLDGKNPAVPVLILDKDKVREKAGLIGSNIRNSRVFYAVKANPDLEVQRFIGSLGLGFEIASEGELGVLSELGVEPSRIISSNPVKSLKFLEISADYGLMDFAFDSEAEVKKIASYLPGARVYLRLSVPNEGSEWPLSRKFGVELDRALKLITMAAGSGLDPAGITFHVGSQCLNKFSWNTAIYKARELWEAAGKAGIVMRVLNIGGGYPIAYTKSVVGVESIEKNINKLLKENFPDEVEVYIEPGRAIVGDAGVFVASVIGKAKRGDENWIYIDTGVFNGLMESIGGIKYSYVLEDSGRSGERGSFVIAGPSCDSFDVIDKEVWIREPEVGDYMLILSAGAYTVSYASEFNGFAVPETTLI